MFRSRYVLFLEEENARLREERRLLLDRMLAGAGYAPLTPELHRKVMPKPQSTSPYRVMAQRESDAWKKFNAQFGNSGVTVDEINAERKAH
jgi:hypothetical protein